MYTPRVLSTLAQAAHLRPGEPRIDSVALTTAIISHLIRATWDQALYDMKGIYTRIAQEMVVLLWGIDLNDPDQYFVKDMLGIYTAYVGLGPDGPVQMSLNGDNRSFLCSVPTIRAGVRYRSSRFITNDPSGALNLNQVRVNRAIAYTRSASVMRTFTVGRQAELAGPLDQMFLQGSAQMASLMRPISPALQPPAEPQPAPPEPEPPADAPQDSGDTPSTDEPTN